MNAYVVHIETSVEYTQHGEVIFPDAEQRLLWAFIGFPEGVVKTESRFETEIDHICGFNQQEITSKFHQNIETGEYSFLPAMGFNHQLELRSGKYQTSLT